MKTNRFLAILAGAMAVFGCETLGLISRAVFALCLCKRVSYSFAS